MMDQFEDKVVIVTGGAKGIGQAYVEAFFNAGARVAIADIDLSAAETLASKLAPNHHNVLAKKVDVGDLGNSEALAKEVWDRWHRLDVLVNNAANYSVFGKKPFTEINGEEWDQTMAINLRGMLFCTQAVFPYMKQQGYGKIINISSTTALKGTPYFLHYVTSKAGVIGFTRALAREVGDHGIRVNAIAPGLTVTEGMEKMTPREHSENAVRERCLKRPEFPKDLVGTVLFLASEYSDFITGQLVSVDGGAIMH